MINFIVWGILGIATVILLAMYFKKGKVKVEIALCKGKKLHDKREDIKKKTAMREIEKAFKESKR